jgi:DNA-binding NtrC family response regulator
VKLLLVDDEPALAKLLAAFLERAGHSVALAATGEEGLARFAEEPWDAVIADLTLPGISGEDMVRRMLEMVPPQPVIISSGYPYSAAALPAAFRGQIQVLQKPYLPKMLAEVLERISAKRSGAGA